MCWEHVVAHRAEESVAFWSQPNKLLLKHQIQFVLEECDCLAIHSAIEGVVEGVLTEIIVSRSIPHHTSIDIFCLDSISQTIRVREQQSQLIRASLTSRVRKTHIDGSIQCKSCHSALDSSQTINNVVSSTEIRCVKIPAFVINSTCTR